MKRLFLALALGLAVIAAQAQTEKIWSGKRWTVLGDSLTERFSSASAALTLRRM